MSSSIATSGVGGADGVAAVSVDVAVELLEAVPLDEVSVVVVVVVVEDEPDADVSLPEVVVPDDVVVDEPLSVAVVVPLEAEVSVLVDGAGEGV